MASGTRAERIPYRICCNYGRVSIVRGIIVRSWVSGKALAAGILGDPEPVDSAIPLTDFSNDAEERNGTVIFRRIRLFAARLGWFGTAWGDQGLAALTFGHPDRDDAQLALERLGTLERPSVCRDDQWIDLIPRLRAYCDGQSASFLDIPLDLTDLTDFQRRVSLACRQITWGDTCTYGELASRIGSPRAARAVGSVMARNRLPIVIPCHRVLGARGRLGGFSAPGGLDMKRRLLRLEGVREFSDKKGISDE